jgi:hypothetical protein
MIFMNDIIKNDIISVLQQTIELIQNQNFSSLKEVSNHTMHNASIYQDEESIQVAVIVYALAKILERTSLQGQKISTNVINSLKKAIDYLKENNFGGYTNETRKLFKQISERDERLWMYIQNVVDKANIVKGSSLYKHGLSIARVSEILGINQWDLMSYIGKTRISDEDTEVTDYKTRINFTKRLFKVL